LTISTRCRYAQKLTCTGPRGGQKSGIRADALDEYDPHSFLGADRLVKSGSVPDLL